MKRSNLHIVLFILAFIIMASIGLAFGRILAGGDPSFLYEFYPQTN